MGTLTFHGRGGQVRTLLSQSFMQSSRTGCNDLIMEEWETEPWPVWVHGHSDVEVVANPVCLAGQQGVGPTSCFGL